MAKTKGIGPVFILVSTLILGAVTGISHFIYEWSGSLTVVGLFNPINESVWEHLKFLFFPNLLWWIVVYLVWKKRYGLNLQRWIIGAAVALVTAPLLVTAVFYVAEGAFGVESLIIDIVFVFICYFIALNLANHVYTFAKASNGRTVGALLLIAVIFAAFLVFTFYPPHIPLFRDPPTGTYGIYKTI